MYFVFVLRHIFESMSRIPASKSVEPHFGIPETRFRSIIIKNRTETYRRRNGLCAGQFCQVRPPTATIILFILTLYYEGVFRSLRESGGGPDTADLERCVCSWHHLGGLFSDNPIVLRERVSSSASKCGVPFFAPGSCYRVAESFIAATFIAVNLLHPSQPASRTALCVFM